jgi:dihydrodipicolinate synthase/N-acetylneuraminate lyase
MKTNENVFLGCIPALMTPCSVDGTPNFKALVAKGQELTEQGMHAVVYCGSMGDWPLLTDAQRQDGVRQLTEARVPVVVGTGAQNTQRAVAHAAHAAAVGASGLMVLEGNPEYSHHFNPTDTLSDSQREFVHDQWQLFRNWWRDWPGASAE